MTGLAGSMLNDLERESGYRAASELIQKGDEALPHISAAAACAADLLRSRYLGGGRVCHQLDRVPLGIHAHHAQVLEGVARAVLLVGLSHAPEALLLRSTLLSCQEPGQALLAGSHKQ